MTKKKRAKAQPSPQAMKDQALDQAAGGGAATLAAPVPSEAKKPGRTTFANIVLERG